MSTPLLAATDLRLDEGGRIVVEHLSFATRGDKVLVFGGSKPILRAAVSELPVRAGALRIGGRDPLDAARSNTAAVALLDPALPPNFTPRSYVEWSARLSGADASSAKRRATSALEAFSLVPVAEAPLGKCVVSARRATVLAAALATGAKCILFEDPTQGFPDDEARRFAKVVVKALADVSWAIFASRIPLESPLALEADDALVLGSNAVLAQGLPADLAAREKRFSVLVRGDVLAFAEGLSARGFTTDGEPPRFLVDLGEERTTRDLFLLATDVGAVIVELLPVAGALA